LAIAAGIIRMMTSAGGGLNAAVLHRLNRAGNLHQLAGGGVGVSELARCDEFDPAALSSLSPSRATIFSASSGKRPLQRLRLIPRRAHSDVALFFGHQVHRHRLRMDGSTMAFRRSRRSR